MKYHINSICSNNRLHPVSVTRFPSFRTQTLENLSRYQWRKRFLSNPDPGENLVMENLVMETGCRLAPPRGGVQRDRVGPPDKGPAAAGQGQTNDILLVLSLSLLLVLCLLRITSNITITSSKLTSTISLLLFITVTIKAKGIDYTAAQGDLSAAIKEYYHYYYH